MMISHVWIKMISSLGESVFIDLLPLGIPLIYKNKCFFVWERTTSRWHQQFLLTFSYFRSMDPRFRSFFQQICLPSYYPRTLLHVITAFVPSLSVYAKLNVRRKKYNIVCTNHLLLGWDKNQCSLRPDGWFSGKTVWSESVKRVNLPFWRCHH